MMKKFLLVIIAAILLSVLSPAQTYAMTMPQTLHLDGLTFTQPLTITNPRNTNIQFRKLQKITVKKQKQPLVLAEKIISPAPKKLIVKPLIPVVEAAEKEIVVGPTPTALVTPTPTPQPLTVSTNSTGGLDAEKLFSMINSHRTSIGLAPLQKDANLCSLAQSRAPELSNEIFNGTIHAGFRNRNLPYWATENMIHQNTEEEAFNWWMNSSLHRSAIEGSHTHACGACQGKSCAMIFTSFQPK